MIIIFLIFYYIFIWINIYILINDYINKKIPNKSLIYLLIILPIFLFLLPILWNQTIELVFIVHFFLSFIVTFLLYYFWIWWAWDAKYLLILSLFLPQIWILTFIANIAILTLGYLLIFFIYFYLKKITYDVIKWWNFIQSVYFDLKEKFYYNFIAEHKLNHKSLVQILWSTLLKFLVIFTSLRLLKIYIFDQYILDYYYTILDNQNLIADILNHTVVLFFIIWASIFLFYFLIQKGYNYIYNKILNFIHFILLPKINIDKKYSKDILIIFMLIILIVPILIEYKNNPLEISHNLYLIASYYLWFYIIFKIFYYLYKITFQVSEMEMIDINKLKVWEIIDKWYLIDRFANENCLWAFNNPKWFMYPSPKRYINNLENPIDKKAISDIKKAYKIVNKIHDNWSNNPLNTIKTLKTFAFSWYIFWGFILSYLYSDDIFKSIITFILNLIKSLYS
mgnify:CR=1 FL=1